MLANPICARPIWSASHCRYHPNGSCGLFTWHFPLEPGLSRDSYRNAMRLSAVTIDPSYSCVDRLSRNSRTLVQFNA